MQRLLMGEVGSGKTVLALYAMLRAREAGAQAALMAPTETLAEQHFATLETLLAGSPVPIALLTGSTSAARRRETLARLATGELPLIVGTHALIEPTVEFARLAVVVVDEQHRFGVAPAPRARRKGPGRARPARPAHDRHADPADPLADRLRRPRHDDAARAAGRPAPDQHLGASVRNAARAPTGSSATASTRAGRPSSSARWSASRRRLQAKAATVGGGAAGER